MKRQIATMVLSLLIAGPAFAQRPGGGFGGGGGGLGLLMNASVQKELKLDSDQTEKVTKIAAEIREKHADDFASARSLEGDERREKMTELNRTIGAESKKALAGVLKPEQVKRYEQIQLQQRGVEAFADPAVQSKLKLTDDQKDKIKGIAEESRNQVREVFAAAGDDRAGAVQKLQAIRKSSMEKVAALLTDDQKSTWKDLTGEHFAIVFQPRAAQ